MFAGQMKLRTFLVLAAAVGVVGLGGAGWLGSRWWAERTALEAQAEQLRQAEADREAEARAAAAAAAPPPDVAAPTAVEGQVVSKGTAQPPRREHQVAFSYRDRDLGTDKLKDVSSGEPFKVNVYQDAGKPTANRAKIDLDRDDKWDEKLTFDGDRITLQVAPADDERYTETYHWGATDWVKAP